MSESSASTTPDTLTSVEKLKISQKMIQNKDDTLKVMEETLNHSRSQVNSLTENMNAIKKDRDSKVAEIAHLRKIISIHEKTITEYRKERTHNSESKLMSSPNSLGFQFFGNGNELEIEKYKCKIDSLYSDLEVMEDLYKMCNKEVLNQDEIINSLRQTNLDNQVEILDLKVEVEMMSNKKTQNFCSSCKMSKKCISDIETDLHDIADSLSTLKNILIVNERLQVDSDALKSELLKMKNNLYNATKKNLHLNAECKYKTQLVKRLKMKLRSTKDKLKKKTDYSSLEINKIRGELILSDQRMNKCVEENKRLCEQLESLQLDIKLCNERNEKLESELRDARESVKSLERSCDGKSESVAQLESQLAESSEKGAEMCDASRELFGYVRALMKRTKEERKLLLKKMELLQSVNEYISPIRRDDSECERCKN